MTSQSADINLGQRATATFSLINTSPGNYVASIHYKIQTGISGKRISKMDTFLISSEQTGDYK